ncbi:hypothetical protein GCM10010387_61900 [Streptomyces inusitatus]|uniref:Uncharacterized protein n=1 Tax=Streptomyces inusitatus TaxID=68221 RepID=A0A918QNU6_9ACTN|nr:hypothetical protein GCM10010387_61900 [Streptomyces inusitatus]
MEQEDARHDGREEEGDRLPGRGFHTVPFPAVPFPAGRALPVGIGRQSLSGRTVRGVQHGMEGDFLRRTGRRTPRLKKV